MIWETSFLILQKFDDTTAWTVKIVKFYLNTVRAKYIKNRVFLSFFLFYSLLRSLLLYKTLEYVVYIGILH